MGVEVRLQWGEEPVVEEKAKTSLWGSGRERLNSNCSRHSSRENLCETWVLCVPRLRGSNADTERGWNDKTRGGVNSEVLNISSSHPHRETRKWWHSWAHFPEKEPGAQKGSISCLRKRADLGIKSISACVQIMSVSPLDSTEIKSFWNFILNITESGRETWYFSSILGKMKHSVMWWIRPSMAQVNIFASVCFLMMGHASVAGMRRRHGIWPHLGTIPSWDRVINTQERQASPFNKLYQKFNPTTSAYISLCMSIQKVMTNFRWL